MQLLQVQADLMKPPEHGVPFKGRGLTANQLVAHAGEDVAVTASSDPLVIFIFSSDARAQ